MLEVGFGVVIPDDELQFSTARSSGPGGQHVNTTDTKVLLRFNIPSSSALTDAQKALLQATLATRLDSDGALLVTSQSSRSQLKNKEETKAKLAALLRQALAPQKKRRPTRPTKAAKERRLQAKKARSERKQGRGRVRET